MAQEGGAAGRGGAMTQEGGAAVRGGAIAKEGGAAGRGGAAVRDGPAGGGTVVDLDTHVTLSQRLAACVFVKLLRRSLSLAPEDAFHLLYRQGFSFSSEWLGFGV